MTEPSASVYRERGRVWVRMELDELQYEAMVGGLLLNAGLFDTGEMLVEAEREKTDQSDIMARFDDVPKLGD